MERGQRLLWNMARYTDSVCRMCRREGLKLFLKGERCYSDKCAIERREYAPGQHGQGRRSKLSEFGVQLREKQKFRRVYGILEKQFRRLFAQAERSRGETGKELIKNLEARLDNLVYRFGFASSRSEGRLLVIQGHFLINGHKVDKPGYQLRAGDVISLREKSQKITRILGALDAVQRRGVPEWLELDREKLTGTVRSLPEREQITFPLSEQLIVEFYSK